jgi:hypothetical protein
MAQARAVPGNSGRIDYPRMLYHPDGRTIIAETPEEHDKLAREGWEQMPLPIHQQRPATTSASTSGTDPLAVLMREVMQSVLEDYGFSKKGA